MGQHQFKARAGHHLAPLMLSSGQNVFKRLGVGLTLLAFGVDDKQIGAFERAALNLSIPLNVVQDSYVDERTKYEARLILVRPDQFVAWIGSVAEEPALILQKVVRMDGEKGEGLGI